jgi:PKD repeat protein
VRLGAIFAAVGLAVLLSPKLQPLASESNPLSAGEAPVCDVGGPYPCQAVIRFDGRGSYDPDGIIVSYAWDFGDGETSTEAYVTHHYQAVGTYQVSLLVVDNDNLSSTCGTTVEVHEPCEGNCPPNCDAAGPYSAMTGEPILFDGTGSSSANTCLIVLYAWDFGDGATGVGPQPTHTYSIPSTYIITLTVTDSDGAASSCTTTAEITDPSVVEPATWGRIKHRRGE